MLTALTRRPRCAVWLAAVLLVVWGSTASGYRPMSEVRLSALPPEGRATVALIQQGGPFPYRKDGVAFGNRERRLPPSKYGYYREYTVPTPGSRDRGARRIIAGDRGELYYSDDHYRSFRRIIE
jgi:ribonuclease T1